MGKKKRWLGWVGLVLACILLLTAVPMESLASGSVIKSASLRVTLRVYPGDTLPDENSINTSDNLKSDEYGCSVTTTSDKYYVSDVEWLTSHNTEIHVGGKAKMKVTLEPTGDYYFRGSYGSSNITIKGGEYVSSKRSGDRLIVTLTTDPLKGEYDSPDDAYWRDSGLGGAKWTAPDNTSDYYDVYLYRGSTVIKKLEGYKGTSYNFYPYMMQKGTYSFKVRTVPRPDSSNNIGKKSEWTESDEIYISQEDVSNGQGQDGGHSGGQVGWVKTGDTWYYYYPDGSCQTDSWLQVNGYWYLFDSQGRMLTGRQDRNGQSYLLRSTGDMVVGWYQENDQWYYYNQEPGAMEGALCKDAWIQYQDRTYYVDKNGVMARGWTQVGENWYYFDKGEGSKLANTTVDGFVLDADGIWRR